jgi:hypothetical protein
MPLAGNSAQLFEVAVDTAVQLGIHLPTLF